MKTKTDKKQKFRSSAGDTGGTPVLLGSVLRGSVSAAVMASLALALSCASAPAQEIDPTVPDPNLATAVRTALGLAPDTPIEPEMLLDLRKLEAVAVIGGDDDDGGQPGIHVPVTDLTGLEHAGILQTLYLRGRFGPGHQVKDLSPIAGLSKLEVLRLPNALEGTPEELSAATAVIGGKTRLTHLSLEDDGIDDTMLAPVANLVRLEILDIDDNEITDLAPIAGLRGLRDLDIDRNPIRDLAPLGGLQSLKSLDARSTMADFGTLPALRHLEEFDVGYDFDLGPLARLPNLQSASVRGRLFDLTPLANLPFLREFGSVGIGFGTTDLTPLRFSPELGPYSVSSLLQFSQADPSEPGNAAVLEAFAIVPGEKPDSFDPEAEIPDGRLRSWNLDTAGISTSGVLSLEGIGSFPNLQGLSATEGWITDLAPLRGTKATRLDLRNNFISDVSPLADAAINVIDLSGNPIDPDTVPAHWRNNTAVILDPVPELDPAQTVPDPALREAIRLALGLPAGAEVDAAALARVVWLRAENRRIRSLAGLEHASGLRGAALRNNIIKDLAPVASLPALQWFRVSGNRLSPAATATVGALRARGVRVDDNESGRFLSSITPVDGMVFASGYRLTSVRYLRAVPGVEELFLSDNYLAGLDELDGLEELRRVHVDGNVLGDLSAVEALRTRGIEVIAEPQRPEANPPGGIPAADPALSQAISAALGLPYAAPAYTKEQLDAIKSLEVRDAAVSDPTILASLTNLEFLKIERGGLTDITFLASLVKLERLDLDSNRIDDLSPVATLTRLVELDVNNNRIGSLAPLAGLAALESLDIDTNQVSDVSPLHGLAALSVLDIHANRVSDFTPLLGMPRLDFVDLRLNGLNVDAPAIRAMLEDLSDEFSNGGERPQFLPTLTVDYDRERNVVAVTWTAEKGVSYWVQASPETANTSTSTADDLRHWTVLSFGGDSGDGSEMRHEFPTDTWYRWIRVVPYLPVDF